MTNLFQSSLAPELEAFIIFKRNLGYRYNRSEFTLRFFDRFLTSYTSQRASWSLDQAILAWLANRTNRKSLTVSADASALKQFCKFLRRLPGNRSIREPVWPRLPKTSDFVPYIFSNKEIRQILKLTEKLERPPFYAHMYHTIILVLYCTGIRFGEALRLRIHDVDTASCLLFIAESKGRSHWVPIRRSLANTLERYLSERRSFARAKSTDRFFIAKNHKNLPVTLASGLIRRLFIKAGLKPRHGRVGPRPYDFRHTFAVHRLTRWYRQGIDLHSRLPWLSAYMGHVDIYGTEVYLTATPELLALAGDRFRRRYLAKTGGM